MGRAVWATKGAEHKVEGAKVILTSFVHGFWVLPMKYPNKIIKLVDKEHIRVS